MDADVQVARHHRYAALHAVPGPDFVSESKYEPQKQPTTVGQAV